MDLQQAANEAMAYLDSVGVAADYDIDKDGEYGITVMTDGWSFQFVRHVTFNRFMNVIKNRHPQKSPA